ncbi:uncharacterized protein AB9X84_023451 [Acanthopagrus schlegelii]
MGNVPSECYMGDRLRCCKCHKVLPPCVSFNNLDKAQIHGRFVFVFNGGEYYRPMNCNVEDGLYECENCFHQPIREQERMRRQEQWRQNEETRRRGAEKQNMEEEMRRQEERQKMEEKKRRQEERQMMEEKQRRQEERQMMEEKKRRQEERQMMEEKQRRQEERQKMEEKKSRQEERQKMEEKKRRQEERQKMEEKKRRQEERQKMEEKKRRQEERQMMEEKKRRQEERQMMEEKKRRQEERKMMEEKKRRQEERQMMEEMRRQEERQMMEEMSRQKERQWREEMRRQEERQWREEMRRQEERQWREEMRRQEERQMMEEEMKRQKERQMMEEEMRRQEERQMMEDMRRQEERQWREEMRRQEEQQWREEMRRQEERQWREEMRKQEERQMMEEEMKRQKERQMMEEEMKRQKERQMMEEKKRRQEERQMLEEKMRRQEQRQMMEEMRRQEEQQMMEEKKRRQEERQMMEEEMKRQKERQMMEEKKRRQEERQMLDEMRRQEEQQKMEEKKKRQEERQMMEDNRRRQEESQMMEEKKRRQEERQMMEEMKKQEERRRREEEKRKQEERQRRGEEERQRREEEKRKQEERQRRGEEEKQRREEEKRKQEERQRRGEEEKQRREEEKRKQEERRRTGEEERQKREEMKKQEESQRREEEKRKQEERQRRGEEERQRREEEKRKQEERWRTGEEERQRREEEKRKQEESRRIGAEERQRTEEDRRRRDEGEKRKVKLNQRLKESQQRAEEQREERLRSDVSEELESRRDVLITHLDEFEVNYEADSDADELLQILSAKCSTPVPDLSLTRLTADQLGDILSVLDTLLFDEWISARPSLGTLRHAQVFITELCRLSVETSRGVSLQNISEHVQSLVESISQSAANVFDSFLLTQALYLNLMHSLTVSGGSDTDAVVIAKHWAEDELSAEQLFLVDFLGTLTSSLQSAVGRATVFILQMEIQCLKLLLSTLTHVNETISGSTEMILRLVQTSQWTPTEAVTLLKALSQKHAEDVSIAEVLALVQLYDLSPDWTDESGRSLIQVLDSAGPERFHQDLQKTLRRKDESSLAADLADLKMSCNVSDSVIDVIRDITTGVLQYSENAPKDAPLTNGPFKFETLNADDLENFLSWLCEAVFDTKGWRPTVKQMLRWCVLVLTQKSEAPQLVGVEEDPCVAAMFAATQVCMGNKLDIVLSSDVQSEEWAHDWSDFYKHLGVSFSTNVKTTSASYRDVYEADIVFGTMDDFVSDYFQHGVEAMEKGNLQLGRGFVITRQSLSASNYLELSRLRDNDSLVFAAEVLQSLLGKFHSDDMKLRHRFIQAFFQVLHTHLDHKIITISKKIAGKALSSAEVFLLTFVETLLRVVTEETDGEENSTCPAGKWCLEVLFVCVDKFQASKEESKELFQMISKLIEQTIWSPVEALNLLGALTDHHHDEGCVSIRKILHLMATYQVSSTWTDENNQSLLKLSNSLRTKNLIQHLKKSLGDEKMKSIDFLFDELRQMEDIDEQTLSKSYSVVTFVTNLIKTGKIKKHTDVQRARKLSPSRDAEDLQELLAILCNAVHLQKSEGKLDFWPRATQMISWCLLALSDTGKLLEMGTGEGKSCVIAMFAALRALRGEKVDVVSSSSVLCQRDAEEWNDFYKFFGITADTNTNKTKDEDRKDCYQKDVVYGTIEAFAADHLRQVFEMKDVRPDRGYQCIIVDEVDSLLLDQGVQMTYLSSPMVSMQHLNIILAMIWTHISQYGFLSAGQQTFVRGPPASFFKAIFDSMNTEGTHINDPTDILRLAEESNTVPKGLRENICNGEKDVLVQKLKTVSQDAVVDFFQELEQHVPCGFNVYTLDNAGLLCLRKRSRHNNQDIPELKFLVLEEGLCCPLYDSEETVIKPIAQLVSERIQYTPCANNKDKISIPGFLKNLVKQKVSVWVQNAFLALQLKEGHEYVVENDSVCPVDFRSTGIVELNKKWGDGLQQFVEIKHQIKLSTISTVTNYISNIAFFEKYHGKIYGTTGTLGSKTDMLFLQDLYPNLSACKMPTFNRKKLFEVKGTLKTSAEVWKKEIKRVVLAQTSANPYRGGRAALVICETINAAKEIYDELKSSVPGEIILYCRSDTDSLCKIDRELLPGDVIVATNLAGRGTDIKVSKHVNSNGGLCVILSFLSENTRVELQAFGRTARKGKPGSAQIIMSTEHLQPSLRKVSSLEEAKNARDRLSSEKMNQMMDDVAEMKLREELFSEYIKTLQDIHEDTDGDEKRAVVAIMNEFWGIWLQTNSEEIVQLKTNELRKSLKEDLSLAKSQSQSQNSPCSSIYHYIKFGNIALIDKQWAVSTKLFEKAMKQDRSWAAIAFYNHAYCTIQQRKADYLAKARDDLMKAQESLKYLSEEPMVCLQFVKMSSANSANSDPSSLEKQLTTKCSMLSYFDKNIEEAIQKLDEIKGRERDAIAKKSPIFSLVLNGDEDLQVEAENLYSQGLKYVFSVEEEPRFSWEGLLVFCLGVLQIVGGALLIAFTFGTFAQVGMGLITEGISDCISGIESMVKGDFSWKSWAIEKAISIGVTFIGFGVGKLIAKGFKSSKVLIKEFGKELKLMPSFFSSQAKEGLSEVAKTNMKNAIKHTAKKMVEEITAYGLGKAEEEILNTILSSIKNKVEEGISKNVKSNMERKPLATFIDEIILSHLEDKNQLHDLLKDENRRNDLMAFFRGLSSAAVQPFYEDLGWQKKLNSSLSTVIQRAKAEAKGTAHLILTTIQVVHMAALASDAVAAALSLTGKFFSNLQEQLNEFKKEKGFSQAVKVNELSDSDADMLKDFKQDLADTISALVADALVEMFHQKFSSHLTSHVQRKVNGIIGSYVRTGLQSNRTEELLRAGQNNRYITHMPVDMNSKPAGEAGKHSQSHADKIMNSMTPGTLADIRVLSETTGTKVVILTQDSQGHPTKMQELSPSTKPASRTVTLIYTPKSAENPDGHYDVYINNQTVKTGSQGKSCLFRALATGMKPKASEDEITSEAQRLRSVVADTLRRHPGQWEPFIKRNVWTASIRGGDWFIAEGAADRIVIVETLEVLQEDVGRVSLYKEWQQDCIYRSGLGQFMNGDHQPPVKSILEARGLNQNSRLAEAMLEVATKSSPLDRNLMYKVEKQHGRELPVVYVPYDMHREFPSTTSKKFRTSVAEAISDNDVVGTFKLTILGAMPRFKLDGTKGFENFQNDKMSKTRLEVFDNSFQQHSLKMVETWSNLLKDKNVMTDKDLQTINTWINKKGYNNQNDPHRDKVYNCLQ